MGLDEMLKQIMEEDVPETDEETTSPGSADEEVEKLASELEKYADDLEKSAKDLSSEDSPVEDTNENLGEDELKKLIINKLTSDKDLAGRAAEMLSA